VLAGSISANESATGAGTPATAFGNGRLYQAVGSAVPSSRPALSAWRYGCFAQSTRSCRSSTDSRTSGCRSR
jgi:hypothetical protein